MKSTSKKTMKNLKTFILLFVGIITMSLTFTSCNTDTEDYSISEEMQGKYQEQMAGVYSRGVAVLQPNSNNTEWVKVDSIDSSWRVGNDSTITLTKFPMNRLDSAINVPSGDITSEATTLRALRDAISKLGYESIRLAYYIPNSQCVTSTGYQFVVNPLCVASDYSSIMADFHAGSKKAGWFIKKNLTYAGETHTVWFVFYLNYYGGVFTSNKFEFQMVLASIYIDDNNAPTDYNPSFSSRYFRPVRFLCH